MNSSALPESSVIKPWYDTVGFIALFTQTPSALLVALPFVTVVIWHLLSYWQSPLRKYPGPWLAKVTNFWRMYHAYSGSMHLVSKRLHDKYGPVVRVGPNHLDLDYPSLIKTCYDRHGAFKKLYAVSGVKMGSKIYYNIFSETDTAAHTRIKKPIAKYFSMNGVLSLQGHIDSVLAHFSQVMDKKFVGSNGEWGPPCDWSSWILYLTWDMVAQTTYGAPIGYLDHGHDFDGTLSVQDQAMDYLVTIGMCPSLDHLLNKNPIRAIGPPGFDAITALSFQHLMRRVDGSDGHDPARPDFLDRYLEAQRESPPGEVDQIRILSYLLVNMAAGAETTAVALRSVFYLCLKHPPVWSRLQTEVLTARFSGLPPSFAEARALPYLEAVVRESLRLFPGNCFPMERYVPGDQVLVLPDGSVVPGGTAIGLNAYIINRNSGVWGPDAEKFRPDRWLRDVAGGETESAYQARLTDMNNGDLSFGGGNRKCIGQNLGLVEVYKTVATVVGLYELELANPTKEWTIHNSIFPRQSGIEVRLRKRPGAHIHETIW